MIYTRENPKLVKYFFDFEGKNNFTGIVKDEKDAIAYYLNGKFHRTDGPAVEYANDGKEWCLNGKLHREDGPAIEHVNGDKEWCLNNMFYGVNDDFTNESWIKLVKLELLK